MDNDRILLMNNWLDVVVVDFFGSIITVTNGEVKCQGYYDDGLELDTRWVHRGDLPSWDFTDLTLLPLGSGTNHVMYSKDGTKLWVLEDCRAGTPSGNEKNWIPCSSKSLDSNPSSAPTVFDPVVKATACVIMRNSLSAYVMSPYYEEGIGTIYFDVVNMYKSNTSNPTIVLEFATNVTEKAQTRGLKLSSNDIDAGDIEWKQISFDVLTVKDGKVQPDVSYSKTDLLLDAPEPLANGSSNFFYRVRACLHYRGECRFRIRRTTKDTVTGKTDDAVGLILVDNIHASYPPESLELKLNGSFADTSSKGASVLGRIGDFSEPFLSLGQTNVSLYASYIALTNSFVTNDSPKLVESFFNYRWRYLNQIVEDSWKTIPLKVSDPDTNQLKTSVPLDIPSKVGDLEYFISGDVDSVFYKPTDYAFDTEVGWGDWTEEIKAVTNRLDWSSSLKPLPSCGTDYFTRIREGVSDYESVTWHASTNGVPITPVNMELVGDHMWRMCYYVPTNAAGNTIKFRFSGKKVTVIDPDVPCVFNTETNDWFATVAKVPYLPYTSVADQSGTMEQELTLDDNGTHLIFEFNDELHSYSISHGTYQNFNMWSDAVHGFRGSTYVGEFDGKTNIVTDTGVSDRKEKYNADFSAWETSGDSYALWKEYFQLNNTDTDTAFPQGVYFPEHRTPAGWTALNGMFTIPYRGAENDKRIAFQMRGGELPGSLSLDKLSNESMPEGVGKVIFTARMSQSYNLDDFARYGLGATLQNYGVSAKISMSRLYDSKQNPSDISTVNPCVSLLGYYREGKGAYEFRITRSGAQEITTAIYKWEPVRGGTYALKLLAENKYTRKLAHNGVTINHLLVPEDANNLTAYASVIMFIENKNNEAHITCKIANNQSKNDIEGDEESSLQTVVSFTDKDSPLTKGAYGVGAKDCRAVFGKIKYHPECTMLASKIELALGQDNRDDWDYEMSGRWNPNNISSYIYGWSTFFAAEPLGQDVELMVSKADNDNNAWISTGWVTNISSFATNTYVFTPYLPDSYKVRLQAGDVSADEVVISEAEVRSWRGKDFPASSYGSPADWVYTTAWIETAIEKPSSGEMTIAPASDSEYAFIFRPGETELKKKDPVEVVLNPKMDIEVTRVLLVGGDGKWNDIEFAPGTVMSNGVSSTITIGHTNATSKVSKFRLDPNKDTETSNKNDGPAESDIQGTNVVYEAGTVVLRARVSSAVCTLQPARGYKEAGEIYPMGIRSPFLNDGMSTFSFSYMNANSNTVLILQIATNAVDESYLPEWTDSISADYWTDVARFDFTNAAELASGTITHFMSLREHYINGKKDTVRGAMRLIVAPEVIETCLNDTSTPKDIDYGKITITRVYCCNEPPLDLRSWWGWNLHTEGWNTPDKEYAYINDSPEIGSSDGGGLSCILNFSAFEEDNLSKDAKGIGLGDPDVGDYKENNPFVQSPELKSTIGSVSFRARLFDTNNVKAEIVLYGTDTPSAHQVDDANTKAWERITGFTVTNTTYQTYSWSASESPYTSVRLEVPAARHGRNLQEGKPEGWDDPDVLGWEEPAFIPINRVAIDEVLIAEPVTPRLLFQNLRPFRTGLNADEPKAITNIAEESEQPITGESWGIQVEVVPQQMSDSLDTDSMRVFAACFEGDSPWGYQNWSNHANAVVFELEHVGSNLVFRSAYTKADSIRPPVNKPNTCVQYYVWATYKVKSDKDSSDADSELVHALEPSEWSVPKWYYGLEDYNIKYGKKLASGFSAYTIFDSISPRRAWINEISYVEKNPGLSEENQFIEIAVPQGADIEGWRVNVVSHLFESKSKAEIARFGTKRATITSKLGEKGGSDFTNHYAFVSLRSPLTAERNGNIKADGIWEKGNGSNAIAQNGSLAYYYPYGFELVRPSGIVEHQVIVGGENVFNGDIYTGENMLSRIKVVEPNSLWFAAGVDLPESSIGVWTNHGENASCWTNFMYKTSGELNRLKDDKTIQNIDRNWFLLPNGTNMWIYAFLSGYNIEQQIGKTFTTNNAVLIVPYGISTSIVYNVDHWYRVNSCVVNGEEKIDANVPDGSWTLKLDSVTNTVNIYASAGPGKAVTDAGLNPRDPYCPAIMNWLQKHKNTDKIIKAHYVPLSAPGDKQELSLRMMYWFDIPPDEEGWEIWGGMGDNNTSNDPVVDYVEKEDKDGNPVSNIIVKVYMNITNTVSNVNYAPDRIQGLEPGSSSYDYENSPSVWTSATFKVAAALVGNNNTPAKFVPVRWFVFGPESFDPATRTAKIEIEDPYSNSSPTYYTIPGGWGPYRGKYPVFYKFIFDASPATYDTPEMLKADSTYPENLP